MTRSLYLSRWHEVLLDVLSWDLLPVKAVVSDDDFDVFVKTVNAVQQDLEGIVAHEGLGGDGDLGADVCEEKSKVHFVLKALYTSRLIRLLRLCRFPMYSLVFSENQSHQG